MARLSLAVACVVLLAGFVHGRTLPVSTEDALLAPSPRATVITPDPNYEELM